MQGLALNEHNDIFLDSTGNLAIVKDLQAVKTAVLCATQTNYGELPLNTQKGIPYFETILTAHPDIDLWKRYMQKAILSIPQVLSIVYFKTYRDYKDSLFKYAVVINTEYGQEEING